MHALHCVVLKLRVLALRARLLDNSTHTLLLPTGACINHIWLDNALCTHGREHERIEDCKHTRASKKTQRWSATDAVVFTVSVERLARRIAHRLR